MNLNIKIQNFRFISVLLENSYSKMSNIVQIWVNIAHFSTIFTPFSPKLARFPASLKQRYSPLKRLKQEIIKNNSDIYAPYICVLSELEEFPTVFFQILIIVLPLSLFLSSEVSSQAPFPCKNPTIKTTTEYR